MVRNFFCRSAKRSAGIFPDSSAPAPGAPRLPTAFAPANWRLQEFFEDGRLELYILREDLNETNNLAAKMPDKVKQLHDKLAAWRKEIGAPMPTKNLEQIRRHPPEEKKEGNDRLQGCRRI